MYISFIGLRLTKTSLTLINRTRFGTIDPFKSIFSIGKKSQSMIDFFAIYCDLLRFIAIYCDFLRFFPRKIKFDTGRRLKRAVKIYSLHGFPFRYSRKFKIDRVESYRMTHH